MQKNVRVYAAVGAVVLAGLILLASSSGAGLLITWLDALTPGERAILRTLCLFVPVIVIPLGVVLQRRRKQRPGDEQ